MKPALAFLAGFALCWVAHIQQRDTLHANARIREGVLASYRAECVKPRLSPLVFRKPDWS